MWTSNAQASFLVPASNKRVWILAKLPDTIQGVGHDITDKHPLLSNSHDGGSSVQVEFTSIRVVRQNTLTMALSGGRGISIQHTRTPWAAYNGVTEYVDHAMSYRDGERHLDAIWFGSGCLAKARAYRVAVQSAAAGRN